MQIILREDVANVGKSGELLNVKPGFGRNYLIPRGFAVLATPRNVKRMEHDRRVIEQADIKRMKTATAAKARIEQLKINIARQVGGEGKLFGSVTTRDIVDAVKAQGVELNRKAIKLSEPIKTLGVHEVPVKLHSGVSAELKVWVVSEDETAS